MTDLDALRRAVLDATLTYATNLSGPSAITAETAWTNARTAYRTALAGQPPLWTDTAPALLTPVRLECRYLPPEPPGGPVELAVRVIPDTVARYQFDADLTADELSAARIYWAAVAASGADTAAAWITIQQRLGDARAAWAVESTRTGAATTPTGTRTGISPATSLLLPDKFTFRGWRDGVLVFQHDGLPITPTALTMGPDFDQLAATSTEPGELAWTGPSKWMVDFGVAVEAGMAIKIPMPGPNLALDSLTVIGVSPGDPTDGAQRWAQTLQGHLYTDGLGYPPVGAPTNNTDATRSQWTTRPTLRRPDEVSAAVTAALPHSGQPGVALADAFGLTADVTAAAPGRRDLLTAPDATARDDGELPAAAYRLLADYYFLLTDADPDQRTGWLTSDARCAHFATHVRSDGPLPILRVGRQPYGVLPVTSLLAWGPSPDTDTPADVVDQILVRQALRAAKLGYSPRLTPDTDDDQDTVLLSLLQRQPGPVTVETIPSAAPIAPATPDPTLLQIPIATPEPGPAFAITSPTPIDPTAWPLAAMSTAAGVTTVAGLQQSAQQSNTPAAATLGKLLAAGPDPATLTSGGLYWVLQAIAASRWIAACSLAQTADQWTATSADIQAALAPLRALEVPPANTDQADVDRQLAAAAAALSHRLDAWATSVASGRLRAERATTPTGLHLGMYGWLCDIEPTAPELSTAVDGWVMTPSVQHAVTAAVLFAGAQGHSSTAFDIDLSSARVRNARSTLAGLRNGSSLEELLGYQLERALHDHHFDTAVAALRQNYPLRLYDTATTGSDDTARTARLVTDGDAVRRADRQTVTDQIIAALPPQNTPLLAFQRGRTVGVILDGLDDTVDAVGDVLMAESVHHLAGGNPLRAGLAADVIGRAAAPPDPLSAISTPTSGVTVTHTLALAVTIPAAPTWPMGKRAALDPAAEALTQWAFGPSTDWQATVAAPGATLQTVPLTDLAVSAVDVAVELTAPVQTSALAVRVRAHTGAPAPAAVTITRTDGHGGPDAAPQLAAAVRTVLARCRAVPAAAAALSPAADTAATADLADLTTRITTWWTSVQQALQIWQPTDPAAVRTTLETLADLGLNGARTDAVAAGVDLHDRWAGLPAMAASGDPPGAALMAPPPPSPPGATAPTAAQVADWLTGVAATLRRAAGDWITPAPADQSLTAGWAALPGIVPTSGADQDAVAGWIRQHAALLPGPAALTDLLALSGACGAAQQPNWLLRQQPGDPAATGSWLAISHPGTRSATALTCLQIGADAPAADHVLLVVDQWTDSVPLTGRKPTSGPGGPTPDPQLQAALALRVDSPDSHPPQALLLATPPDPARGWRAEDLYTAVEETLWWSMARPIDAVDDPDQEAKP